MKKFNQENYEKCARAWFNRYYRFRERYFTGDRIPDELEEMHLEYLRSQYKKFADLAAQAV